MTIGTATWVYLAETMPPRALGIAMFWRWFINGFLILLEWALAHFKNIAYGEKSYDQTISVYFFFYSGVSIWGYFIVLVFVQETKDLGSNVYKSLYRTRSNETSMSSNTLM